MKKVMFGISLFVLTSLAHAEYGVGVIKRFYAAQDGRVYFGLVTPLANTCSSFGEHFKFDASTPGGKNMLSTVIVAKMGEKTVNVWYTASLAPGTNETNGCNASTLSILTHIGIP